MRLVKGLGIHGACTTIGALQKMFRNVSSCVQCILSMCHLILVTM